MSSLLDIGFQQAVLTMAFGLARIAPALLFLPMLGEKPLGRGVLRATLLTLVTLGLLPVMTIPGVEVATLPLAAILPKEALTGLILGLALGAPFWAATAFGELLDNQRGATIAKSITVDADIEASLLGSCMGFLWAALFFAGDGLMNILSVLAESYRRLPIDGTLTLNAHAVLDLGSLLSQALMAGVAAASPAVVALLLIDVVLGVLSRFASQLNPFSLALTIKSLGASLILLLYLSPHTFTWMHRLYGAWPLKRLFPGTS